MKKAISAAVVTIIAGYLGFLLGGMMNLEGYLGILFAIAIMGAFIIFYNEKKK